MPRNQPEKTSASASSSGTASSAQGDTPTDTQAAVEAALSNIKEEARRRDWATMTPNDKLDFIVNEKMETMESTINEIFARSASRAFKFDEKNKGAEATLRRLKESQTWLGTQVEELQRHREQLGFVVQTYLATLSPQDRHETEAILDNIVPDMDERIEMIVQTLYSGLKHQVVRMEDIVAKVATGLFQWMPCDDTHEDDKDMNEVPPDSVAPKPPVDGVIDVDSVREQLEDYSFGLCTADQIRGFIKTTTIDGIDLVGRMADALVSKDAELAKVKRAIRILLGHLDNSVDFVTGHIRNDAVEQRFSDEDELYVIRNKERIMLAYAKKELTGIDELDASVRRVAEQMRQQQVENERFRKASAGATALSRDELVRQNANSHVQMDDFRKKVNELEAVVHDNNDAIKCLRNFVADLNMAQDDLQEANRTLKSQLDKAIDEVKTRSDERDMLRDELEEERVKLASVGDVDGLQTRLDNVSKQLTEKAEEGEQLLQSKVRLSAQCDEYKEAAEEDQRAITALRAQFDDATSRAEKRARELVVLQENAGRMKKQLESERAKQSELQTKLKKSNQERAALERCVSELRTTNSRLERQLTEAQSHPRTEHERMRTELDAVRARLEEAQSFLTSREDTINRLQQESEEIFETKLKAVQNVAQLESELKDAEETVALLAEQVQALNVAYAEKRRLEAVVEELRRALSLQDEQLTQLQQRAAEVPIAASLVNGVARERTSEMDQSLLTQLRDAVYPTLCGRYTEGYTSIRHLLDDLRTDTDRDGEHDARELGFSSFTEFLQSSEMRDRVIVETVYKARTNPSVAHLHREQEISASHKRAQIMTEVNKRVGAVKCENERLKIELRVRDENVGELTARIRHLQAEVEQSARKVEELKGQIECQVCMVRPVDTVFVNCGHLACHVCTQRIAAERPSKCYNRCAEGRPFVTQRIFLS